MKHLFHRIRINERTFASQFTKVLTKIEKNANETHETIHYEFLDALDV